MQVSFVILQLMEAVKKGCILLQRLSAVRCISHKCTLLCRQALERYSKGGSAALSVSAAVGKILAFGERFILLSSWLYYAHTV